MSETSRTRNPAAEGEMAARRDNARARLEKRAAHNAEAAYELRTKQIEEKIEALRGVLERHAENAATSPRDWGYAGDLAHVEGCLDEALAPFEEVPR